MDMPRLLSGSELVARGVTKKTDVKLPTFGFKEVSPSGSWLEQKQIQSAIEACKQLIEVERIEKSCSLSHALWRDDMNLAEVTQKSGGYWQYFGHNVGKQLYLLPEETLFLIETSCLLLKHNEVTVSLQKAYSLCLGDISIRQYKVYASLSRLGYRVFRHKKPEEKPPDDESTTIDDIPIMTDGSCGEKLSLDNIESSNDIPKDSQPNVVDEKILSNEKFETGAENPAVGDNNVVTFIHDENINMEIDDNRKVAEIKNSVTENNLQSQEIDASKESKGSVKETSAIDQEYKKSFIDACVNGSNISKSEITVEKNYENVSESSNKVVTNNVDVNNIITNCDSTMSTMNINNNDKETSVVYSVDEFGVIRNFGEHSPMKTDATVCLSNKSCHPEAVDKDPDSGINGSTKHFEIESNYYNARMQKLIERKSNITKNLEALNAIQDFYKEQLASVNVPDEKYLPRSVFLHKAAYVLNVETVRNQRATNANVSSDEMEMVVSQPQESHGPDSSNAPNIEVSPQNIPSHQFNSHSYRSYRAFYRPSHPWTPQHNFNNYFGYNMYRPPQTYFIQPRLRPQFSGRPYNMNYQTVPNTSSSNQFQNKRNNMKMYHYSMITSIATRFKRSIYTNSQVRALHSLLNTYNRHYDEHLELTSNFDVINKKMQKKSNEQAVEEVIVLDDEPKAKKARLNDDSENVKQNLEKLRALAAKLKELQMKDLAVSRHRRVFSNAIKTFNKYFNADIYLDSDFEIKDRKLIVIDSSSDSDTVVAVEESSVKTNEKPKKRKKLRNPFSILKLSSTNGNAASSSQKVPTLQILSLNASNKIDSPRNSVCVNNLVSPKPEYNGEGLLKYFNKAWLPSEDDFGRAELCSRVQARLDSHLFEPDYNSEVLKESDDIENWLDLKISVLKDMQHTLEIQTRQAEALSNDFMLEMESQIKPIVRPDCDDLRSALKQLAIIQTNKHVPAESRLRIDFDVCNRDVTIRKTNLPKPNFRIICLDGSGPFPSSEDVAALQSKYTDDVPIVYAFDFIDSISYLHCKHIDLPVFVPEEVA